MGLVITVAFALGLWIALWSVGAKSFDGFMLAIVILLIAAAGRHFARALPGNRTRD